MSTQNSGFQQDLTTAFQHVEEQRQERIEQAREQALEGGARYRNEPTTSHEDAGTQLDDDHTTCQCGATVTQSYYQFHCDSEGVLHHCQHCTTASAMKSGAGAMPDYERRVNDDVGGVL